MLSLSRSISGIVSSDSETLTKQLRWQVNALQPYFFVYCQNPELSKEKVYEMLQPVLRNGERGRVVRLDNVGREGAFQLL